MQGNGGCYPYEIFHGTFPPRTFVFINIHSPSVHVPKAGGVVSGVWRISAEAAGRHGLRMAGGSLAGLALVGLSKRRDVPFRGVRRSYDYV